MINVTYLKAHHAASSLGVNKGAWTPDRDALNSGMNTKLQAICDSERRPLSLFVSAGQVSDDIGAWAFLNSLPNVVGCLVTVATMPIGSGTR